MNEKRHKLDCRLFHNAMCGSNKIFQTLSRNGRSFRTSRSNKLDVQGILQFPTLFCHASKKAVRRLSFVGYRVALHASRVENCAKNPFSNSPALNVNKNSSQLNFIKKNMSLQSRIDDVLDVKLQL